MRELREDERDPQSRTIRIGLKIAGTVLVAVAMIGIALPILPTTPFLLLAAACYARSSRELHNRLLYNRWLGRYIRDWYEGRGIPLRAKALAITSLVLTIGYSILFVLPGTISKAVMVGVAIAVTVHILRIPTREMVEDG